MIMSFIKVIVLPAILLVGGLLNTVTIQGASLNTLAFKPCSVKVQTKEVDAECATLKRFEDLNNEKSNVIELSVVRFASYSTKPAMDAFTVIQGGPGGSSIDMAITFEPVFEAIRRDRDIIVMDQRGTGRSNPLFCDTPQNITAQFDAESAKKLSQNCVETLSQHSDLRFYNTSTAVDDLEALRVAAGYTQLNLYGVSYGTRVVQHYLRKYPDKARSAILDGVAYVGLNLAGGEVARRWEDSFEALNQRCKLEAACFNTHGDLRENYRAIFKTLSNNPVSIAIAHPINGQQTNYTLDEHSLLSAMRLMAYNTENLALMPLMLSKAKKGNYGFLASQAILTNTNLNTQFASGMHNSVICTEDAPFVSQEDQSRANETLISTLLSEVVLASCSVWPIGIMDNDFLTPFKSPVPVLILSGETDPITPPKNGDTAASMLGNTLHVIVPAHGHGVLARGCLPALSSQFIKEASFSNLNTQCTEREIAMPIFMSFTGPTP